MIGKYLIRLGDVCRTTLVHVHKCMIGWKICVVDIVKFNQLIAGTLSNL